MDRVSVAEATDTRRTTFVANHCPSRVGGANVILVFEEGQLVERGTHAELMEQDGLYASMYRLQMGESVAAP